MHPAYEQQIEEAKCGIAAAHKQIITKGIGVMGIVVPTMCSSEPCLEACRELLRQIPATQAEWIIFVCVSCNERVYPDERTRV